MKTINDNVELLSPVGNFECLKAAIQNGADSVYFGANSFSARSSATNFSLDELKSVIHYSKIRNVKTNLTLNTLIKNEEFDEAINLAKYAYENGIDAIIVQDLGLAKKLIEQFPNLPIHSSTQMTIHNLEGAIQAEKLGFKRVVLSRECSLEEIKHICKNTNIEIEVFIHGALCISYSGQCLLSSMIGGRSGNRGRCAQPCRLPYKLTSDSKIIDEGYLLSTKDLCGLEFIPQLIQAGVKCFKIEGRMKTPEYVATVTKIYRKYINLAKSNSSFFIEESDKKDLLQVFNRGGFSSGHLDPKPNQNLVYQNKPNNMGLFLGSVHDFNHNKGYITLRLQEKLKIGDTISLEKESGIYTISELMINGINKQSGYLGDIVKIGRMKGNIGINDKIFKLSDKELSNSAKQTFSDSEFKKIYLNCNITIKKETPIEITIFPCDNTGFYKDIKINLKSDTIPVLAIKSPITKERIISQISKTGNTPYEFKKINIDLDDNLYIPNISCINELRRLGLEKIQEQVIHNHCENILISRKTHDDIKKNTIIINETSENFSNNESISILLNKLDMNYEYNKLDNIQKVYLPLNFFLSSKYSDTINKISSKFDTYIYLPLILKISDLDLEKIIKTHKIKGFVLSNISHFNILEKYSSYEFIGNYSLNIFNNSTIKELSNLGLKTVTLSPETDKESAFKLITNNRFCNTEIIVYGKTPVMTINYCLISKSNKCYYNCSNKCSNNSFYLRDRLGFDFQILPDNYSSVTTIYNSKITSLCVDFNSNIKYSKRIDFIDETIENMQNIIDTIKKAERLEGDIYTNGSFNRQVQ